jgi:phage terminase large subunit-like protein
MLSDPTKTLDALILEGDAVLAHDANPILAWCLGNVVTHEDTNGNIKPNKGRDPKAKTDGAIALIMALSRALVSGTAAKVTANIRLL